MNGLRKMVMENKHLNRIIFASTASLAVIVLLLTYILSSHYETMACEEIYRNASSSINQTTSTVRFFVGIRKQPASSVRPKPGGQ